MPKVTFCSSTAYNHKGLHYRLGTSEQFKDNGLCSDYYPAAEHEAVVAELERVKKSSCDIKELKKIVAERDQAIQEIGRIGRELGTVQAERDRLKAALREFCPHKQFTEISFEDGYPGGDIATYECLTCGYRFKGELPQ